MNRVVVKNIIALLSIHGMNNLIPLITLPYLVRTLGAGSYGELGFTIAFVQYFALFTEFGFNLSATRKISLGRENKEIVSDLFWTVISCKMLLATSGLILLLLLMQCIPMLAELKWVMLAYYLSIFGALLFPVWLFQGLEKMGWIAACNITAKLTAVPLTFWLIQSPADTPLAALILSITNILAGLIALFFVYRNGWIGWCRPSISKIVAEIKDGWHVFISVAAISIYSSGTVVMLGFITNPVAVGYYVAADKFRQVIQGLIGPFAQAIYPRMNALFAKDRKSGLRALRILLVSQGSGTFMLSLCLSISSAWLIETIYGAGYQQSVAVLRWLAWVPFIVGVSNVLGVQTLLVLGFKKSFGRVHLSAGVFSVFILIPLAYHIQELGAAISTVAVETMVCLLMALAVRKNKIPLF